MARREVLAVGPAVDARGAVGPHDVLPAIQGIADALDPEGLLGDGGGGQDAPVGAVEDGSVETGVGRIKGVLPPDTPVGHKTGTIGGTTNDVGYIYLPDDAGHVITVVFVKDSELPIPAREATIAHSSRAIYDFFLFNPE